MAILVSDLILSVRSRLTDEDRLKYKYPEAEVIDALNSALAHLSEALLCFTRTWVIPCKKGIGRYELPEDFLRLISVSYQGKVITDVQSMESRMNDPYPSAGVSLDLQTIHFFPGVEIKEKENISLYYHYYETISDKSEMISLPKIAKETIVFYMLFLLFQRNVSSKGIEKSNYYLRLYERELQSFRSRVRKNQQSKHICTDYIRV